MLMMTIHQFSAELQMSCYRNKSRIITLSIISLINYFFLKRLFMKDVNGSYIWNYLVLHVCAILLSTCTCKHHLKKKYGIRFFNTIKNSLLCISVLTQILTCIYMGENFLIKNNILKQTAKIVTLTLKLNQYNHF